MVHILIKLMFVAAMSEVLQNMMFHQYCFPSTNVCLRTVYIDLLVVVLQQCLCWSVSGMQAVPATGHIDDIGTTSLTVSVSPHTRYTAKIRVVNHVGEGPYPTPYYTLQTANKPPLSVILKPLVREKSSQSSL